MVITASTLPYTLDFRMLLLIFVGMTLAVIIMNHFGCDVSEDNYWDQFLP